MNQFLRQKFSIVAAAVVVVTVAVVVLTGMIAPPRGLTAREAPKAPPPPEVEVAQIEQRDVPIYGEWIGTLDGMVNADVKAQVQGYLLTKDYVEGSFVKKGQLLFEVDPRPFQAALDQANGQLAQSQGQLRQATAQLSQAQAQLAQAEANQGKTQLDVNRYTPLAGQGVIPQQDLDNAVQSNLAAKAQVGASAAAVETASGAIAAARATVQSSQAAVQTAQLNLGFTNIVSPIDGVAGIAQAQVGNLVNPSSAPLTTVSTVDPIKVYFTVAEQEYLNYIRRSPTEMQLAAAQNTLELELVLADGTIYPQKGKFFAADRNVDQQTGAIRLAGLFPNSGNILRPGQYGRVRAATAWRRGALLVPQRAVTEMQDICQVAVVGNDNKIDIRAVKVGERVESMWIITDGLRRGESVVIEGTQKVRPGAEVTPRAFVASRQHKEQ
jgi:membrane fusion protein (multidrug efflux system)